MKITAFTATLMVVGGIWLGVGGARTTVDFDVVNTFPFDATVTMMFPGTDAPEVRKIRPGDQVTITAFFGSMDERTFDIAITADGPVPNSIYDGQLVFDGDIKRTIANQTLPFRRYEAGEANQQIVLAAPLPHDRELALMPDVADVDDARLQARELAGVLEHRFAFLSEWQGRPAPVLVDVIFADENGAYGPGTTVESVAPHTPLGGRVDLKPSDEVVAINDRSIYSDVDVYEAVWQHVVASSAAEPFRVRVVRDGQVLELRSAAYYNVDWFTARADEALEAGVRAAFRATTLASGFDIAILCAGGVQPDPRFPPASCRVQQRNRETLLSQQHPLASTVGSTIGVPIPILRLPLMRVLPSTRGGRAVATIAGEAAQFAVWAHNDAPANIDRTTRAIRAAPWGAGVGLLITAAGR